MSTPDTLSRRALNRALLARQMLLERQRLPVADAIERLIALQAQEPQDPYVTLWSRIEGFDPMELSAMLEDRRVVRAPNLMRTTIHLATARDALMLRAAVQPVLDRAWGHSPFRRNLANLRIDPEEVVRAGRELLAEGPMTLGAMGKRLKAERWPEADAQSIGYAVHRGVPIVQPPPRGLWRRRGAAVIEEMERWLRRPIDGAPSLDKLVMRYLGAFGPATPADFRTWSWLPGARDIFERLRPRLRIFRDERGRELFDVPRAPLPDPEMPAPVRLLAQFDNATLSHEDRTRIIDRKYALENWLKATVLVDGFVRGSWALATPRGGPPTMSIRLDDDVTLQQREEVEAEADRLVAFLAPEARRVPITWSVMPPP